MKRIYTLVLLLIFSLCVKAQENKRRVAIFDCMAENTSINEDTKTVIREIISSTIVKTHKYDVVERALLEKVMEEQGFQHSGIVNESQITDIGKIAGANKIVLSIITVPQSDMFVLSIEMLDVETGNIDNKVVDGVPNNLSEMFQKVESMTLNLINAGISTSTSTYKPGQGQNQTFTVGGVSFKMIYVQGGSFNMGCTYEQGGDCRDDEGPVHQVTLSDYYIGEYEVTQDLWQAVMGTSVYQQRDKGNTEWPMRGVGKDYPIYYVSYAEAQDFCDRLTRALRDRLQGVHFRLPTEAQWEYAARGGNKSKHYKYAGSNYVEDVAYYSGNSNSQTHPVGMKQSNELGLYDMSGNVWEWCSDWYGAYSSGSLSDPRGPATGSYRVYRGGSWIDDGNYCRVSFRSDINLSIIDHNGGFRLVLLP